MGLASVFAPLWRPLGLRRLTMRGSAGQMHVGETTLRCSPEFRLVGEAVNNGHYFWRIFEFVTGARKNISDPYKPPRASGGGFQEIVGDSPKVPPPVAGMAQEAVTLFNMRPFIPAGL